ncbi:MAG: crotonobetainyl-CoA:carnitine CoA-transferase CaiB-like acyl-CoA transferase [Candidatus Azotimanducaceae bacterium]|jgi:crotonobetainyl-CoA:carnitine CoA-transferase CaiB-like acyl-CoA transferase
MAMNNLQDTSLANDLVRQLFEVAGLPDVDLSACQLTGDEPLLASSFHVGAMAQGTIAAAALAAGQLAVLRGGTMPAIEVELHDAEYECTGYFELDGRAPDSWAPLSGLYPCADGFVRIHANFDHHRDGALALLGLQYHEAATKKTVTKEMVIEALAGVSRLEFETRAAAAGMPIYALRSFTEWDALPQAKWLEQAPLFTMTRLADADPLVLPALPIASSTEAGLPLADTRVLDLTRILAGPVCGRTLAHYGADVMLVNSPNLPNIEHIADTSRGKRSVYLDLLKPDDATTLKHLVVDAHVFIQGYRPGGLAALGFSPEALAALRPGIVSVSLSAFGKGSPWSDRRGFDSLVQTATGFNHAEGEAAAVFGLGTAMKVAAKAAPKALPVQILDFASGFIMAFAVSAALIRQQQEGGSWHIEISLAQTAHWLRSLGRSDHNFCARELNLAAQMIHSESGFGLLGAMPHATKLNGQVLHPSLPSMPPGTHPAVW